MTVNEMNKYIGKEYYACPPGITEFRFKYELFSVCPERNIVILDACDGENMYSAPLDTFPFEDYVKEEN